MYRFLQSAADEDRSVLFISLGEKIYYQEWCLKAILDGLKKAHRKLKMKVVWLLRQTLVDNHPVKSADFIMVAESAPLIDVLSHPTVKAGVSHCGFSELLDFVAAGVPVLTFPHFSDQSLNAELLADAGAAIELIPSSLAARAASEANLTYTAPVFNEQVLANKVVELLTNSRYGECMGSLQTAAAASGGADAAASAVEEAFLRADDQADMPTIRDLDYRDKVRSASAIKYYCLLIWLLAFLGYTIWAIVTAYDLTVWSREKITFQVEEKVDVF